MKRPVPRHLVQPSAKRCSAVLYSGAEATGATRTGPVSPLNRLAKLSFSSLVMKISASPNGSWRSYLMTCPGCQHDVDLDVDNPGRYAHLPGFLEALRDTTEVDWPALHQRRDQYWRCCQQWQLHHYRSKPLPKWSCSDRRSHQQQQLPCQQE